jgi:hypothetical protein
LRPYPTGLKDDEQVRGVGSLRQHGSDHGQAGADKDSTVVFQKP